MIALTWGIEIIFSVAVGFILLFSISQLLLSWFYFKSLIGRKKEKIINTPLTEFPFVTIQLPVYNEKYVIERLIDSVANLNYPRDRFEIQVLDDSNDETSEIAAKKTAEWAVKNIQIIHIQRPDRTGFKAGALRYGTALAKGEFIAIFDADFLPPPDFLHKSLPAFSDPGVAMVQTHWSHLNENYSLLTRMQAYALDAHFSVEQKGRNSVGAFINFNGTAGTWRKIAIEEGGGWQADTLTEDLDLSYRVQMKGWKFVYLEDNFTHGELPVTMSAVKTQQFRWMKGPAEVARKNLSDFMGSSQSVLIKMLGFFHLFNSTIFIWVFVSGLSSLAILVLRARGFNAFLPDYLSLASTGSLASLIIFYTLSRIKKNKPGNFSGYVRTILDFPVFLCFCLGFSLHNSLAVLEGMFGKPTSFIRTPKFGIVGSSGKWSGNTYHLRNISLGTWLEGLLAFLFLLGMAYEVTTEQWGNFLYHLMLFLGFSMVFSLSVIHSFARK